MLVDKIADLGQINRWASFSECEMWMKLVPLIGSLNKCFNLDGRPEWMHEFIQ